MIYAKDILTIERLKNYISSRLHEGLKPTFTNFCDQVGFSSHHANRVFREVNGVSPGKYIQSRMDEYIKENRHRSSTDVANEICMSKTQVNRRAQIIGVRMGGK